MSALAVRLDNFGDVLLTGPAVRALAEDHDGLRFLASPRGASIAALLEGVDRVEVFDSPWIGYDAPDADADQILGLVGSVRSWAPQEAVIFTSFHQSPLPMALILRMAGVERISATCVDHPGSLLDVREPYRKELHEVEQNLAVCASAGHRLKDSDDRSIRLDRSRLLAAAGGSNPIGMRVARPGAGGVRPYVVMHPGASVPARALPLGQSRELIAQLLDRGIDVVVTGSVAEGALVEMLTATFDQTEVGSRRSSGRLTNALGRLNLAELALVIEGAEGVVCGNTGPAHLSAAVGTPVIQAFAPVVPLHRWRPWGVAHKSLGNQGIDCAGCRSTTCPLPGQPCLDPFTASAAIEALEVMSHGFERFGYAEVGT